MTDGSFIYDNKGKIFKKFGHDSDGIKIIKKFVDVFLISADKEDTKFQKRAKILGLKFFMYQKKIDIIFLKILVSKNVFL